MDWTAIGARITAAAARAVEIHIEEATQMRQDLRLPGEEADG